MNDDQATGLCGGIDRAERRERRRCRRAAQSPAAGRSSISVAREVVVEAVEAEHDHLAPERRRRAAARTPHATSDAARTR